MAVHLIEHASTIELIEAGLDQAAERGRRYGDADWTREKRRRQALGWLPL